MVKGVERNFFQILHAKLYKLTQKKTRKIEESSSWLCTRFQGGGWQPVTKEGHTTDMFYSKAMYKRIR